jgi:sigma-B regulation protein RsbU (phosphoserine phosphatase)
VLRVTTTIEAPSHGAADTDNRDLATAGQLQRLLLPPSPFTAMGWTAVHHFAPAGIVSGDYVDLMRHGDRLYFMLGDVSGKGVAASMLMAQLHAMFRSLIPFRLSLDDLMTRASALLCASSLPAQYATLVCGYLDAHGDVVISNAGHPPPLAITGERHTEVRATGVPIGLFCESQSSSTRLTLSAGDTLLMYTDGLSEARNTAGEEYGNRLEEAAARAAHQPPGDLLQAIIADQAAFRGECADADDLTAMAIRRT